jgi:hypothetical protein
VGRTASEMLQTAGLCLETKHKLNITIFWQVTLRTFADKHQYFDGNCY